MAPETGFEYPCTPIGWQMFPRSAYPGAQGYRAKAAPEIVTTRAAAIANILRLVLILSSQTEFTERCALLPNLTVYDESAFRAGRRFCREGEAFKFFQYGRIELDGELPLNTFGSSLGTGRIHGL
jgi:hypothetical protein